MADVTAMVQDSATTYAPPQPADVTMAAPTDAAAAPDQPAVPEHISETLYIQNLNERIKVDGM
jgi:hypothetical protein